MMDPIVIKDTGNSVLVGYSGKPPGNTQAGSGLDTAANFDRFIANFPGKNVYDMPAVGKDNIAIVDRFSPEKVFEMEADGLITHRRENLLVLRAADCIPLVFYSPDKNILGLAHVGTSGASLHLPAKMVKEIGVPAKQIHVYAGPHIGKSSYRFPDKDISDKKLDPSWDKYITKEADGIHINLLGYVLDELKHCGVEQIEIEPVDTGADPDFFSHRRHKITGEPAGRNYFAAGLF